TLEDAHTRVVRERDVIPLLFLADLLITDASSLSSEYALMDRPIVFLDVPKLIARVMARNNTMVDMDTWGRRAGIIVRKPELVLDAVDKSLADPSSHAEVRRAMADDLFYNPGRATDEAFDWVCNELAATVRSIPTSSV
ncbi:MAG: CDP-glycerol glycerophosphotransferase family protein, partial [Planctomycetes bacterium]|nr:CDP-glycerol glycerophosphotransferase family protein [Planctomycetota bacterium]